jgi:uncharacterized hydrophobic protein (TIGR00341 family)
MAQRLIKIILPEKHGKDAQELLKSQEPIRFWQEESADGNFVISALTDSGSSEKIMDLFEKRYFPVGGFQIVLLPVEASIPRIDTPDENESLSSGVETKTVQAIPIRISREELYSDIVDSAKLSSIFILMTTLSTVVVAIGLLRNNVAVIIGAMVIAPFLGPNVALSLSTNLADEKLGLNALKTLLSGISIVLLLSASMGFFFNTNPITPEIATRTQADLSDIILALAAGCAGVLAFTTGASSAVIGVMVAVALLPPLTVCGLLLGTGELSGATGAFLLFITNIICINLAGVLTFLVQGVSPRAWWEADKAKKATRKALILWSIILVVLAVVIFLWRKDF